MGREAGLYGKFEADERDEYYKFPLALSCTRQPKMYMSSVSGPQADSILIPVLCPCGCLAPYVACSYFNAMILGPL